MELRFSWVLNESSLKALSLGLQLEEAAEWFKQLAGTEKHSSTPSPTPSNLW